jgi:mono/diheme cytochrome c family protein
MLLLLLLAGGVIWSLTATLTAQTRIVYVAAQRIEPPAGPIVYQAYCASCHGASGRGNGPAAPLVGEHVADLTSIAATDGSFDGRHVAAHVQGMYGANPMPDWHRIVRDTYGPDREPLVIRNLVVVLEGMQVKR